MLNRVADLLEIRGENFFKIRAYREAVRQLDNLTTEVEDMIKEGRLKDVPGIGEAIEKKIVEYVTTGQLEFLTRLEAEVPPALLEITRVPGLGPRTAKDIYDALGILSLDALEDAARTHRLLSVRGIKAKTEENILKGIAMLKRTEGRIYFPEAWILADSLLTALRALKGVARAEIAGSARRACETVGDLDLLVAGDDPDGLRADLHTHSNWSDGRNEIAEMARAAKERGYDYIVLTDHTQSLQIAQGLTPERFRARAAEIAAVNARPGLARVLNGAEVDILPDGSLDLPDETLASLDLVVASVHVALDQPKDVITQRVLA